MNSERFDETEIRFVLFVSRQVLSFVDLRPSREEKQNDQRKTAFSFCSSPIFPLGQSFSHSVKHNFSFLSEQKNGGFSRRSRF